MLYSMVGDYMDKKCGNCYFKGYRDSDKEKTWPFCLNENVFETATKFYNQLHTCDASKSCAFSCQLVQTAYDEFYNTPCPFNSTEVSWEHVEGPIVVNLFGQPGAGKSTGAAKIFYELNTLGINCELVAEFAKDKTWEHNMKALSCQEYVFGKQSYRLARCKDDVDVIITDSPLPLGIVYNENPVLDDNFTKVVMSVFSQYKNINYFVKRVKPYNPKGRNQTEEESDELTPKIMNMMFKNCIHYKEINGDTDGYESVVKDVLKELGKESE